MPGPQIVDTSPDFLACWEELASEPLERQVDRWLAAYEARWPELAAKQAADYQADGLEWRQVLLERVFPFLPERLPTMVQARDTLCAVLEPVYRRCVSALDVDFDVAFVVLALGYGGWATSYEGGPAVLLGLDTLVECGWTEAEALEGLTAHEVGHLFHHHLRGQKGLALGEGPFWQVYEEGFAQRCEHHVMGRESFHMQRGQEDWLAWCRERRSWLAAEYLRAASAGERVYRFFGSWPEYNIEGRHQTGYFLGHEVIRECEEHRTLREIAALPADKVDESVRATLASLSSDV